MNSSGGTTGTNMYGANGLISRNGTTFYAYDERGNVAQRTTLSGQVASSDLYDAYGNRTSTAAQSDPFGFGAQSGYYTDVETGLLLLMHRYYDRRQGGL